MTTIEQPNQHRFALNNGSGEIPALGAKVRAGVVYGAPADL